LIANEDNKELYSLDLERTLLTNQKLGLVFDEVVKQAKRKSSLKNLVGVLRTAVKVTSSLPVYDFMAVTIVNAKNKTKHM
jgi:hypothetical protein